MKLFYIYGCTYLYIIEEKKSTKKESKLVNWIIYIL